jgi:phenylalanyl-tRNA synthetase beta chain
MKLSWRWIKEFVRTDLSPHDAADRLINAGVEVASVTPLVPELKGVVIGEVEAVQQDLGLHRGHHLVVVSVNSGRERFSVVCGAPNCVPGVRAAFAPPSAILPGGRRIEVATIRGVASQGMLCSARELGLGDDHESGILLVDAGAPLGADLLEHLGLDDSILEVEITPNRPDCLSIVGVARELAALTGAKLQYPDCSVREDDEAAHGLARVRVDDPELCPRYAARVVRRVRVAPSPPWLAARLRAVGLRPISNIVDVTNYVLWELGHPLHAFDYDAVREHTIVVRRARSGERLTTLDGQDRTLDDRMLVIADPARAIGIAGVMGGANTEVTDRTTQVLLESAYFQPGSIRRTARTLGLKTDAAYRFERGADIEGLRDALDRAAQLVADLCGGSVARGVIDAYPAPRPRRQIGLRMSRIERLVGVCPPAEAVAGVLEGLGLSTRPAPDGFDVTVPTFRRDLAIEDDLVEEVVRVWGYDKVPSTLPGGILTRVHRPASVEQTDAARAACVAAGLYEVVTLSLADSAQESAIGRDPERDVVLPLLNPLSRDASILRPDLLPGLLRVVAANVRHQQPNVRIFEVGRQFARRGGEPSESRWLGIALTGARSNPAWYASADPVDIYDVKGLTEHVLDALGVRETSLDAGEGAIEGFQDGGVAWLVAAGTRVALFGEISAGVREAFGIPAPVFYATIALDQVARLESPPVRFVPLARYPSVTRDLALVVPRGLPAATVEQAIKDAAGPLLRQVALFDLYVGRGIDAEKRSLAWRLTFQAADRTLTDAEVNELHARVIAAVRQRFRVEIRGV